MPDAQYPDPDFPGERDSQRARNEHNRDIPEYRAAGHDDRTYMAGGAASPFPWPPAGTDSAAEAWGRTWAGASLAPRRFFASMPESGSLGPALLYYFSIGIPVAGAQLFWTMVRGGADEAATTADGLTAWGPLVEFLISPIYLVISLFLSAGVVHLLLKLFGGAGGGYDRTTRVFAFAYSPQILGIIPWAGTIVGFVWMVVVAIAGLREAHQTTLRRAAAAVIIPLMIALAFVAVAELIVRTGGLLDMPI